MDWLARRASNGADRERFGRLFWSAVITGGNALFDDLNLAVETSRSALDKRNICSQAHLVHMPSRIEVVQSIENDLEVAKPGNAKLGVFNVGVVRNNLDVWVESLCRLFGNLLH